MISVIKLVAELTALGVTGDALVTLLARIEEPHGKPRTSGAIRQERYRNRHNASHVTSKGEAETKPATPGAVQTEPKQASHPASLGNGGGDKEDNNLFGEKDSRKGKKEIQHARSPRVKTDIPENFRPSDPVLNDAQIAILTVAEIDNHIARMVDWAKAKGEKMKDWDSFARNWLRREADRKRERESRKPANGYNTRDSISQAFDYIDRRDRKNGGPENLELLPRLRETAS